jgi:tripartite motif-containing protein 2/3
MLGERRAECAKELEKAYSNKQVQLSLCGQKCQESLDNLEQMVCFMEKLAGTASHRDVALFQSSLENRLASYFATLPQLDKADCQLDFISNFQAIQVGVRNQFGYVKAGSEVAGLGKQPPISRPAAGAAPTSTGNQLVPMLAAQCFDKTPGFDFQNNNFASNNFSSSLDLLGMGGLSLQGGLSSSPPDLAHSLPGLLGSVSPPAPPVYPPKAQIKRQKMIYHCKFGEFGILGGQFTEPSGVAVTQDNEIVVADTNNHRIQIFDKEGNFKFQFGEVGKREGQLLYPNRVAVVAATGDIEVTERSPTHQVRTFPEKHLG